jgi:hypothetical protein
MKFLIIISILLIGSCATLHAQALSVNGAQVHVKEGALLTIDGDARIDGGEVRVYDAARLDVRGRVDIVTGGLYLLQDCLATIAMNLTIGPTGVCWRYSPGVLDVNGTIINEGDLNNEGEINIGRP